MIMDRKMKGLLLRGPKQMEVVEEAIPEPGDGQVLLRVDNFNLCGSDLGLYEGTYEGPKRYPIYLGHEWAGEVVAIGKGVEHLRVGDHATGDCALWCGACPYCVHDKNLCEKIEKAGITRDGAARQYFLQDEKYVYSAGRIDPGGLSLAEPLAVVCHAATSGQRMMGSLSTLRILILGGGNMGTALLMVLRKIFHCPNVELYDPIASRMEMAVELGARRPSDIDFITRKGRKVSGDDYRDFYSELAYDLVFESSGSREGFSNALEIVRPLGGVVAIGFAPAGEVNLRLITLKALRISGTIGGTEEFPRVLKAIEKEPEYFKRLVTHRFHYLDYRKAFETAMEKERGLKVQNYFGES
jgi:L-iditol 2-dehydrogenase